MVLGTILPLVAALIVPQSAASAQILQHLLVKHANPRHIWRGRLAFILAREASMEMKQQGNASYVTLYAQIAMVREI
jgi:hypothetical protein